MEVMMKFNDKPYDPKEIELEFYGFDVQEQEPGYWYLRMFRVLNNFFLFFRPMPSGETAYREMVKNNDTYRPLDYPERYFGDMSWRKASQTSREFIEEIERVTKEVHGSLDSVIEVTGRWHNNRNEENCKACTELFLPIYIRLRQEGYSREDLIS